VFLVDGFGYQTALARLGLSGRRDYTDRNLVEKWFQTLKWGSTASIIRGWAVGQALAAGVYSSYITITTSDRINR